MSTTISALQRACSGRPGASLLVLAALEGGAFAALRFTGDPAQSPGPALLAWGGAVLAWAGASTLVLRGHISPRLVWPIVAAAFGMRLVFLGAEPALSDDLYRYLWEGRVWLSGANPYVLAPLDGRLDALRDAFSARVNHPSIPSVYPPYAQAAFAATAAICPHPIAFQGLAIGADLLTILGLVKLLVHRQSNTDRVLLYAWCPLPIVEFGWSGHMDALGIATMVWAVAFLSAGHTYRAAIWAGISAGAKLLGGVVLLPLAVTAGRRGAAALGVAVFLGSWLPVWEVGMFEGLTTYAERWSFNGLLFPPLDRVLQPYTRLGLVLVWGLGVAWAARRRDPVGLSQLATGLFFVCSPTAHPWYLCWTLPWLSLRPSVAWGVLAATVPLSYHVLTTADPVTGAWSESPWVRGLEYGPFVAALAWSVFTARQAEVRDPPPTQR